MDGRRGMDSITEGQEENGDMLWGLERGICGWHLCHHGHCGGHEAPWSPTATQSHRTPPVTHLSPYSTTTAGSGTTVWDTADYGQWPLRVALVAMPQDSPTRPPQLGT